MEQAAERIAEPRRPLAKDDVSDLGRIPPQSLDAERSVLGAMLLSRDAIATAVQHLDERAFYRETHRKIWRAMMALFDAQKSSPVDLVTLVEELKRRKELEVIGGAAYLTSLDQFVATAANVEHYCKIVNEKATLRRLIEVGTEIVGECYDQRKEPALLLDRA
ncbi:MAG: replicative DNA helicase, partial [Candidatus Eisenbacteria bacterium]